MKGRLFIVPIPISNNNHEYVIPQHNIEVVKAIRFFAVEKIKTARQFLRKTDRSFPIDDSVFFELNKHKDYEFESELLSAMISGNDVALISEAGYPGIADPGSGVVQLAHQNNIKVIPLIGPSSVFLALATSGLNGQGFTFHGYLPKGENERASKIKSLCQSVVHTGFAQIFIETPYRNQVMFDSVMKHGNDGIKLTIAKDITGDEEYIVTKSIGEWKKAKMKFDKSPAVFILGQY